MLAGQGLEPLPEGTVRDFIGQGVPRLVERSLVAAGCNVLLVSYGYCEGRDVRELDADGVVATLGEAADLLLR
jgi:hypothetical protein